LAKYEVLFILLSFDYTLEWWVFFFFHYCNHWTKFYVRRFVSISWPFKI